MTRPDSAPDPQRGRRLLTLQMDQDGGEPGDQALIFLPDGRRMVLKTGDHPGDPVTVELRDSRGGYDSTQKIQWRYREDT